MKKLMKNKKGVLGLNTVKSFMLLIMTIAVIAFAIIIAMGSLDDVNVLDSGSYEDNQTTNVLRNVTAGTAGFFSDTSTWFTLLSVVIIIMIIALVIFAVSRFGGGGRETGL